MAQISDLRPSPIAGAWYDGSPERLARRVDAYLEAAVLPNLTGEVIGVIAPHAGHKYSGATAGHAFRAVRGRSFDRVAVVSPLHSYHSSPLLTTAHRAYATPLGPVWVDQEALSGFENALQRHANIRLPALVEDQEHSLEIELPFLQRALTGEFRLLPLMVHSRSEKLLKEVGLALAEAVMAEAGCSTLLVASTDLSHFFQESVAQQLDAEMLAQIAAFSPEGALAAEREERGYACGVGAVAVVLWAARALGANAVTVLHHSTSGDVTGDRCSVVGYGAAAIMKE